MTTAATPTASREWTRRQALSGDDWESVAVLTRELIRFYRSPVAPELVDDARLIAHELPRTLRRAVLALRCDEVRVVVLAGQEIDDEALGPTPADWRRIPEVVQTAEHEVLLLLCGSLLGDAFAWGTRQNGRLINDLLPVRGHEHEQVGTSSEAELTWHTEDAFHPHRPDYLALSCLRNPDGIGTTMAAIDATMVPPEVLEVLFEERFVIRPDPSHAPAAASASSDSPDIRGTFEQRFHDPEPVSVFFGSRVVPFARLDPDFTEPIDDEARAAFAAVSVAVQARLTPLALRAGELCLFDNHRMVHGRAPFRARYDGTDRWLKRLMITTDLNRSLAFRHDVRSRQTY